MSKADLPLLLAHRPETEQATGFMSLPHDLQANIAARTTVAGSAHLKVAAPKWGLDEIAQATLHSHDASLHYALTTDKPHLRQLARKARDADAVPDDDAAYQATRTVLENPDEFRNAYQAATQDGTVRAHWPQFAQLATPLPESPKKAALTLLASHANATEWQEIFDELEAQLDVQAAHSWRLDAPLFDVYTALAEHASGPEQRKLIRQKLAALVGQVRENLDVPLLMYLHKLLNGPFCMLAQKAGDIDERKSLFENADNLRPRPNNTWCRR